MHSLRGKLLVLGGNFHQKSDNLPSWSREVKGCDKKNMHAGGQHQFSKSILQLGNGEVKSKTDGTEPGLIEIPEGAMEGGKIKYKISLQILARKF